jgi:hypothetical protein
MCLFRHKWLRRSLSKQTFTIDEYCSWCGKERVRSLLPADEEKQRIELAYEKGRQERLRIVDELTYQRAKSGEKSPRAIELEARLQTARRNVADAIRAERGKGKSVDRMRVRELQGQLRGLFFGRR